MRKNSHILSYIITDFVAVFLFWSVYILLLNTTFISEEIQIHISITTISYIVVPIIFSLISAVAGTYQQLPFKKSRAEELVYTIFECIITTILIYLIYFEQPFHSILILFVSFLLLVFIVSFFRMAYLSLSKNTFKKGEILFNTAIIGDCDIANTIGDEINANFKRTGYKYVGYISKIEASKESAFLGKLENIETIIDTHKLQQLILADPIFNEEKIRMTLIARIVDRDIEIRKIPEDIDFIGGSIATSDILSIPLVKIETHIMPIWERNIKRIFDIVFAIFGLFFLSPLILFAAFRTWKSSKGTVLYFQERIGKNGKPFSIIKFRSMYVDSEKSGPCLSYENDPRITSWGKIMRKWRIDELPQLLNILKGEMSFVGPRPERAYYINQLVKEFPYYKYILRIRPGLTSWGMVKHGYAGNLDEMKARLKFDFIYLKNASLLIDLKILIYTLRILFLGKGK